MNATPTSQTSSESLSCNICVIVWELVTEIGQNILGMITCWIPSKSNAWRVLNILHYIGERKVLLCTSVAICCGVRLSRGSCNTVGRCIWQHDLKLCSSSDLWPALCSDKRISLLADNSDSTWCCSFVRLCSLVSHLLIHGIVYKDSHDYLMLGFCELKNYYCSSCQSDSIF